MHQKVQVYILNADRMIHMQLDHIWVCTDTIMPNKEHKSENKNAYMDI